jgi:hypothetical protein
VTFSRSPTLHGREGSRRSLPESLRTGGDDASNVPCVSDRGRRCAGMVAVAVGGGFLPVLRIWGAGGTGPGSFRSPDLIAIEGQVYVADSANRSSACRAGSSRCGDAVAGTGRPASLRDSSATRGALRLTRRAICTWLITATTGSRSSLRVARCWRCGAATAVTAARGGETGSSPSAADSSRGWEGIGATEPPAAPRPILDTRRRRRGLPRESLRDRRRQ